MTPQERELIAELFDRLARLEDQPRDPEAEAFINRELARAPHAAYPLVQSVLVQDEALKRANARIRDLENQLGIEPPDEQREQRGFLDTMRDALFGERDQPRGSVPPTGRPMGVPPGFGNAPQDSPQQGYPQQAPQPGYPPQAPGRGGSFLGTAAAAAAGVIGGSLLLDGIRSAWGQAPSGEKSSAFDAGSGGASPWGGQGGDNLAREAGLQDVGTSGGRDENQGYGAFGDSDGNADMDDDFDADFDAGDTTDI